MSNQEYFLDYLYNDLISFYKKCKKKVRDPIYLFHYTNTKVLGGILDKASMWATNIFYQNDEAEFKSGIREYSKIFKNDDEKLVEAIREQGAGNWPGIFSISFTDPPRQLQEKQHINDIEQQWVIYSKENGVCIELDPHIVLKNPEELVLEPKKTEGSNGSFKALYPTRWVFHRTMSTVQFKKLIKDQSNIIKEAFNANSFKNAEIEECVKNAQRWDSNPEEAREFLQLLAAYIKDSFFSAEAECRAAFLCKDNETIHYHRKESGIICPYMEIRFRREYNPVHGFSPPGDIFEIPIKSITVGPGGRKDAVFDSVVHKLNYGKPKIWKNTCAEKIKLLKEYLEYALKINTDLKAEDKEKLICYVADVWLGRAEKYAEQDEFYAPDIGEKYTEFRCHFNQKSNSMNCEIKKGKNLHPILYLCDFDPGGVGEKAKAFMRDNHLTPQGVWVRKSSAPFIY
jgi:hypothetical protein